MNKEFIEAYQNLNLINKRKIYTEEFSTFAEMIKELEELYEINNDQFTLQEIDEEKLKNMKEDEFLSISYQNLYETNRELTNLATAIMTKNSK